jgi:hypothetical protein
LEESGHNQLKERKDNQLEEGGLLELREDSQ